MNNPINSELAIVYREWLEASKRPNGIFCDKSGVEKYSNPYFLGVPDEWDIMKDDVRILVVGQEGYSGHWNAIEMESDKYIAFDEVEKLQEAAIATVAKRVDGKDASIDICGEKHFIKDSFIQKKSSSIARPNIILSIPILSPPTVGNTVHIDYTYPHKTLDKAVQILPSLMEKNEVIVVLFHDSL